MCWRIKRTVFSSNFALMPSRSVPTPTDANAENELSPEEIRSRYGHLIAQFLSALKDDPGLLVTMAEKSSAMAERQQRNRARKDGGVEVAEPGS